MTTLGHPLPTPLRETYAPRMDVDDRARVLQEAVDDFVERVLPNVAPALQPAFAAQSTRVARELSDLIVIAMKGSR